MSWIATTTTDCRSRLRRWSRGGAQVGRVESDNAARSAGGSHSVRKQAATTTGADRRWPQRDTVIHSVRHTASPAPCGWSGRPSSSWSPLLGGRQSAALPDWSSCGAQSLGKTATLVPSSGLFAGTSWTRWQMGGDCNAIAGAQAAGDCSRLCSPIPGPRGSRSHTCRTLPRAGSVGASRIGVTVSDEPPRAWTLAGRRRLAVVTLSSWLWFSSPKVDFRDRWPTSFPCGCPRHVRSLPKQHKQNKLALLSERHFCFLARTACPLGAKSFSHGDKAPTQEPRTFCPGIT